MGQQLGRCRKSSNLGHGPLRCTVDRGDCPAQGKFEMQTGKENPVATLPVYLNALTGKGSFGYGE